MNALWLERSGLALAIYFVARAAGKYRGTKKQQVALSTPLVDAAVLEAAFQPRPRDGDDLDLLAEMKGTFAHLNREAWAEEFWDLPAQITTLAGTLGPAQSATLRRALLRLLTANDPWLQAVAAKSAADLGMPEAVPPLRALLELGDAHDARFRAVLQDALDTLTASEVITE